MKLLLAVGLLLGGLYLMGASSLGGFFTDMMNLGGNGKLLTRANLLGFVGGSIILGWIGFTGSSPVLAFSMARLGLREIKLISRNFF